MNHRQAMAAFDELAANSPDHIGTGIDIAANALIRACARCGVEQRKVLPLPIDRMRSHPERIPAGFDEEMHAWLRSFAQEHRNCPAVTREDDLPS